MADSPEPKPAKRRLRPAADSVRTAAEKAQTKTEKPAKRRRLRSAAAKPLSPVGRLLRKIFYRQPFKFIARILLPKFVRNTFRELTFVTWPTTRETARLSFAVLIFAAVFGISIAVVDYGLDKLFKAILLK